MCGIIGLTHAVQSAHDVYRGLLMLQHRGQDSAGILSYDAATGMFHSKKQLGKVADVFSATDLDRLKGAMALGHTRYSTIGDVKESDLQPMAGVMPIGIGLVHNGNLSNYAALKASLLAKGRAFLSDNDLEVILHLMSGAFASSPSAPLEERLIEAARAVMQRAEGGYSVIGILPGLGLFGFRDPHGIRPLIIAERDEADGRKSYAFASEDAALGFVGYKRVRDVAPGELVWIPSVGDEAEVLHSRSLVPRSGLPCMFEWIYFSSADANLESVPVYETRLRLGQLLASRVGAAIDPSTIDVVSAVPETSRISAIALAETLARPYREVLIKNRYVQRSFILNGQDKRQVAVGMKFSVVDSVIAGKTVLLVDDSIVRGTTSRKLVQLLRQHGAARVYLASSCPPIRHPCLYGIDFPDRKDLVAAGRPLDSVAQALDADGVFYTTLADLETALGRPFCAACLTGEYAYGAGAAA